MKNETKSERNLIDEVHEENVMIYKKYNEDEDNTDDIYDSYSYIEIAAIILNSSFILVLSMFFSVMRFTILFIFSKSLGTDLLTAMAIILPIYSLLQIQFPWATTQYYGYQASKYYSQNSFRNLGLLTNKIIVMNISLALIITFCFYTIIPMILSNFLETPTSKEYVYDLSRYLGFSIILSYWQFVNIIYFLSIEYFYHLPVAELLGFGVQFIFQLIIVVALKEDLLGIGISYGIGYVAAVLFNTYFYIFKNKYAEVNIPIRSDETLDRMFSEFVPTTFRVGMIVFLGFISLEIVPLMSLVINTIPEFTTIGILQNLFLLLNTFSDAIAASNNFLLNRCIGKNKYKLFKSVLLVSTGIITLYAVILVLILSFTLEYIMTVYTNDTQILENVTSLKPSYLFMVFTSSYITFMNESLAVFEDYNVSVINLVFFRFIGTVVIAILGHNYWNWGIGSLFFSFGINNIFIIFINYLRLIYVLSSFTEEVKRKTE